MKDYYSILGLQPSATRDEIKKAYRKLALLFHPDKASGDPYAAEQFTAVKEAYETLMNPSKKSVYLQQRWFHHASGKKKYQPVITPVSLLQQVLELDRYVATLDIHRMDKQGLFDYINEFIDDAAIEKLKTFNDPVMNSQINHHLLKSLRVLDYSQASIILEKLDAAGLTDKRETESFLKQQLAAQKWERYRIWIVLLIVLLICLLIFFIA